MNTETLIAIIIMASIHIIGLIGAYYYDSFKTRLPFALISIFMAMLLYILILTLNLLEYKDKSQDCCPQYEKIENVYKLKE